MTERIATHLRPNPLERRWMLLAAAALLVALAAGAVVVGSGLLRQVPIPSVQPAPTAFVVESAAPPSGSPFVIVLRYEPGTDKVYSHGVVRADGTDGRELWPELAAFSWSPDGSRLLVVSDDRLYLASVSNDIGPLVDTGMTTACGPAVCEASDFALSPDGRRVAFVKLTDGPASSIAVLDLTSGAVTGITEPTPPQMLVIGPRWSTDGQRIAYTVQDQRPELPAHEVVIVDADSGNLRTLDLAGPPAQVDAWSADGAWLALTSLVFTTPTDYDADLYVVRPDGADLNRLSSDGITFGAAWAEDGRIIAQGDAGQLWIVDPATGDRRGLSEVTEALAGLGCTSNALGRGNCSIDGVASIQPDRPWAP